MPYYIHVFVELFSGFLYLKDGSDIMYGSVWPQNPVSFLEQIYVETILYYLAVEILKLRLSFFLPMAAAATQLCSK